MIDELGLGPADQLSIFGDSGRVFRGEDLGELGRAGDGGFRGSGGLIWGEHRVVANNRKLLCTLAEWV
jgi:hypothetical protein